MKTKLLFLGLLLVSLLGFSSCGDDNNNDGGMNAFVGTWKTTLGGDTLLFKFFSSGDFVELTLCEEKEEYAMLQAGSYSISGSNLILKVGKESESATYHIANNVLHLKTNGYSLYFNKVDSEIIDPYLLDFKDEDRNNFVGAWKIAEGYIYAMDDGTYYYIDLREEPALVELGTWNLYKNVFTVSFKDGEDSDVYSMFVVSADGNSFVVKTGTVMKTATKCSVSEVEPYLPE